MSFVLVAPDIVKTAAAEAAQVGSAVAAGNLAAALPTTEVAAAGADEVSAAVAALFGAHAREYQAAAARAAAYHEQFVGNLSAAAASYVGAEATIATSMQSAIESAINAPAQALLGHDLIGNNGPGAAGAAGTEKPIQIDFVRHGESVANAGNLIDTTVPGTGLTPLGVSQANAVAKVLAPQGPYAGIYASQLIRTQLTAAPLAGQLGMNVGILPALNEINAGIFSGMPEIGPAGLLYLVAPVAWTLGFPIVPMLAPGAVPINGVAFDRGFTNALQTMYSGAMMNPVVASNGHITDVAYSSEFAIEVGTMMNVKNPDLWLMFTHPLPNGGIVVVQGDPQDGWTLVSWDGTPVPPATLPIKLFVDARNLITAPQFAAADIWRSLHTGDPAAIAGAIGNGVEQVGTATLDFPLAVTQDLVGAVTGTSVHGLSTALTDLLP
jgi:broad specificity phosphatase PhoE